MTQPCGHPKTAIKKARSGAGWSLWCGDCAKQALAATKPDTEQSHNDAGTIT